MKLLKHRATVSSTAIRFGQDRKLAFTFREPVQRFISGFYSRQRQGRPAYDRIWSPAEAAAFSYFETANDLAEALDSQSEKMLSAAYFAFNSIIHLRNNYSFHFESLLALEGERQNIVACIDVNDLNSGLGDFLEKIGISDFQMPDDPERHANPDNVSNLSDRAADNLRMFWAREFQFYEAFKKIQGSL